MLIIKNDDYHTNFDKNILKDGRCQVIIRQTDCFEWLFDETFGNEEQANEFLNNHWDYFCKISEDIWFTGLHAMQKAFKRYKDRGECWSPRYDLIGKNTFKGEVENGCYGICDLLENGEEIQKIIDSKVKECEDRADGAETMWFACCHSSIDIISPKEYDKFYSKGKKVEFNKNGELLI